VRTVMVTARVKVRGLRGIPLPTATGNQNWVQPHNKLRGSAYMVSFVWPDNSWSSLGLKRCCTTRDEVPVFGFEDFGSSSGFQFLFRFTVLKNWKNFRFFFVKKIFDEKKFLVKKIS